jgi:hypothetical protein
VHRIVNRAPRGILCIQVADLDQLIAWQDTFHCGLAVFRGNRCDDIFAALGSQSKTELREKESLLATCAIDARGRLKPNILRPIMVAPMSVKRSFDTCETP